MTDRVNYACGALEDFKKAFDLIYYSMDHQISWQSYIGIGIGGGGGEGLH